MPALGRKAVAKLFEQRHELLSQHRHQRQAAKRRRVKPCSIDTAASLLSLPEDVLVHLLTATIVCIAQLLGHEDYMCAAENRIQFEP